MTGAEAKPTRWDAFWFLPARPVSLTIVRLVVFGTAVVLLLQDGESLLPSVFDAAGVWEPVGIYRFLPGPPDVLGFILLPLALLLAATTAFGFGGRRLGVPAGLLAAYLVGISNNLGKVNHDRNVLVMALIVLAFAPVTNWRPGQPESRFRWPAAAVRLGFALMLFFAGVAKLRESGWDWIGSENLRNILLAENLLLRETSLHEVAIWIASHPALWMAAAAGTVAAETLTVFGVVSRSPRLRLLAVPLAGSLVVGLNYLMGLGGWVLIVLLFTLPDWDDVLAWSERSPVVAGWALGSGLVVAVSLAFRRPGGIEWQPALWAFVVSLVIAFNLRVASLQMGGSGTARADRPDGERMRSRPSSPGNI